MFDYKAVSMNQDEFTQSFVSFFKERPSFCVTKMAHEIGFDRLNLSKIIFGTRNIPRAKRGIFHNFMSKYGLKHGVPKRTTSRKHEAKKSRQNPSNDPEKAQLGSREERSLQKDRRFEATNMRRLRNKFLYQPQPQVPTSIPELQIYRS